MPHAAVVLAVLAFFALRPGKGWLRRKTVPASQLSVGSLPSSKPVTPILSLASDYDEGIGKEAGLPPLAPGSDPAALSMLSLSDAEAPNSPPRASRSMASTLHATNSLPDSYVSTGISSSALLTFQEPGPRTDRCIVGRRVRLNHIGCTSGSMYSWLPAHLGWTLSPLCSTLCSLQPALAGQRPVHIVHFHTAGCRATVAHGICGFEWTCCAAARCCSTLPSEVGGAASVATDRQGEASTEPVFLCFL